jgi:hypothetical protein
MLEVPNMKPLALAAFAVVFYAAAASAMTPETAAYLRTIGVNPEAADVVAVDSEGPISTSYDGDDQEYSLDTLAAAKRKNGVSSFITTRGFIRHLKENFDGTSIPKTNYDPLYLTGEERGLVGRKFAQSLMPKKR